MVSAMEKQRQEMQAENHQQRQEMQALVEQERSEKERERLEKEETATRLQRVEVEAVASKLREQQLAVLQARLEGLHTRAMLTDEELYKLEDLIEDSLGEDGDGGEDGGQLVAKLVALSERTPGDAALARPTWRQLRRKFA